ncbi:hypothetical protein BKA64DRAFT_267341 [Cadophora sp. MPI-SDFR-AT-0126]|nr:hypothetical protein BKA64DRAFT_267341 [Leotiomycetes sp. MPI-SDFR-AT-0126]
MLSSIDYSHVPALDPPRGVSANFIDPPTIACSVLEVSLPLSVVSAAFVVVRVYTRWRIMKSMGWNDLFLGIGIVLSWVFCALGIIEVQYGYGVDIWNVYTTDVINFLKLDLASQIVYHLALLATKISILVTLLRLDSNPNRSSAFRVSVFCIMAFTSIYSLTSIFIAIFGCSPIYAACDIRIENAKCVDKAAYWYVYAACNIVSSWSIFGLGLAVGIRKGLFGRSVRNGVRWCAAFVVAVGTFVCVVSIVRLGIMVPHLHSENFTKFKVYVARWCEIELTSALILSSLLPLYPVLTTMLPARFPPLSTHNQPLSSAPCRSRKMSVSASTASQSSIPMSCVSSRRDISLEEIEVGLTGHGDSGSAGGASGGLGERRVLGGSVGKKGAVVKTVVYDVKYEA